MKPLEEVAAILAKGGSVNRKDISDTVQLERVMRAYALNCARVAKQLTQHNKQTSQRRRSHV